MCGAAPHASQDPELLGLSSLLFSMIDLAAPLLPTVRAEALLYCKVGLLIWNFQVQVLLGTWTVFAAVQYNQLRSCFGLPQLPVHDQSAAQGLGHCTSKEAPDCTDPVAPAAAGYVAACAAGLSAVCASSTNLVFKWC